MKENTCDKTRKGNALILVLGISALALLMPLNIVSAASNSANYDLTGVWNCDDGGTYYLRQIDNTLWWYGESASVMPANGARWSNIAKGTVNGKTINLNWEGVPKGDSLPNGDQSVGILTLNIISKNELQATVRTSGFGGSHWTRVGTATLASNPTIDQLKKNPNVFYPGINWQQSKFSDIEKQASDLNAFPEKSYGGTDIGSGIYQVWLAYKKIPNDINYLVKKDDTQHSPTYPIAFAHSGGTRTLISKIELGKIKPKYVVLAAPEMVNESELVGLLTRKGNTIQKIIIYQTPQDPLFKAKVEGDINIPANGKGSTIKISVIDINNPPIISMVFCKDYGTFKLDSVVKELKREGTKTGSETYIAGNSVITDTQMEKPFIGYTKALTPSSKDDDKNNKIIVITHQYPIPFDAISRKTAHNFILDDMINDFKNGQGPFDGSITGLAKT